MFDAVKWLVQDKCVDVTKKSADGWSAIMCASRNGFTEIVHFLLSHGAEILSHNNNLETSCSYAVNRRHVDIVQYFSGSGGPIDLLGRSKLGVRNKDPVVGMFQLVKIDHIVGTHSCK